eukprot:m.63066 g.63066  ORF g.63066 m.63066 type:complete len:72 (+) comp15824_c0_seq1:85-300(+)
MLHTIFVDSGACPIIGTCLAIRCIGSRDSVLSAPTGHIACHTIRVEPRPLNTYGSAWVTGAPSSVCQLDPG